MSHLLNGCRAKLERAYELLSSLELEVENYLSQDSSLYRLEGKHSAEGLQYDFIAFGDPTPPLRFSVITGEIIHHMRSSLDHLIHALVLQNGERPTHLHQFPICTTKKAFKNACDRGQIKGVGSVAKQIIESVQPFTTSTPDDTVLYVISQYDNVDKHRLLTVLSAVVDIGDITIDIDESIAISESRKEKKPNIVGFSGLGLKELRPEGTIVFSIKLAEPAPELTAKAPLAPRLTLEQCGQVKHAPLIPTLRNLLIGTQHTVEILARELEASQASTHKSYTIQPPKT